MSQHSKRSVYIVNPATDLHHTTRRSARRYVEAGTARWVEEDVSIEFIESEPRHQAVVIAAAAEQKTKPRPHSPLFDVTQLDRGEYRNRVLGLPNFVGFVPDKANHGRVVEA